MSYYSISPFITVANATVDTLSLMAGVNLSVQKTSKVPNFLQNCQKRKEKEARRRIKKLQEAAAELSRLADAVPGTHRPLCCPIRLRSPGTGSRVGESQSLSRKLLTQQYVWILASWSQGASQSPSRGLSFLWWPLVASPGFVSADLGPGRGL